MYCRSIIGYESPPLWLPQPCQAQLSFDFRAELSLLLTIATAVGSRSATNTVEMQTAAGAEIVDDESQPLRLLALGVY